MPGHSHKLRRVANLARTILVVVGAIAFLGRHPGLPEELATASEWMEVVSAGWGSSEGQVGLEKRADTAALEPNCFTVDRLGSMIVADHVNERLLTWDATGRFVGARPFPSAVRPRQLVATLSDHLYVLAGDSIWCLSSESARPRKLDLTNLLPGRLLRIGVFREDGPAFYYLEQEGVAGFLGLDDKLNWIRLYKSSRDDENLRFYGAMRGRDACVPKGIRGRAYAMVTPDSGNGQVSSLRFAIVDSESASTSAVDLRLPSALSPLDEAHLVGVTSDHRRAYVLMKSQQQEAALIQWNVNTGTIIESLPLPQVSTAGSSQLDSLRDRVTVWGRGYCYLACADADGYRVLRSRFRNNW